MRIHYFIWLQREVNTHEYELPGHRLQLYAKEKSSEGLSSLWWNSLNGRNLPVIILLRTSLFTCALGILPQQCLGTM